MKKLATTLGDGLYKLTRGLDPKQAEAAIKRFLGLLASRQRLGLVPDIILAYEAAKKKAEGVETVSVTTASEPTARMMEEMAKALEKTAGAKVEIAWKTDPSLLGGAVIRHRDSLLDASVRHRLEILETHLTSEI